MVRNALRFGLGRILQLFFRRIEIVGAERVPPTGPVLFAVNHPNALIDPLLLLCYAPRPVSFLAKAPLFTMPVIGWFVRALDSIPVYRRQDQLDVSKNRETFTRARALLERGGTIAIAPEGTSHSGPSLKPLKTGAARIALGASPGAPVSIVPVGLFYTEKMTFRSQVLVFFGDPLQVEPAPVDRNGEPPADRVDQVTALLEAALAAVVVQADAHEALELATRTERILSAALPDPKARSLDEIRRVRQRLVSGHRLLREREPALLDQLVARIGRIEAAFRAANLDPTRPAPPKPGPMTVLRSLGWLVFRIVIFLPLALPGLVLHYPAYRLTGFLARRAVENNDDVLATAKIVAAAILYPLTWVVAAVLVGRWLGWRPGWATLLVAPVAGYAALRLVERFDRFLSGTRALGFHLFAPERFRSLVRARESLREDLLALADRLEAES